MKSLVITFAIACVALPAHAQTPSDSSAQTRAAPRHELCWWNPDMTRCSNLIVTEIGVRRGVMSSETTVEFYDQLNGTVFDTRTARFQRDGAVTLEFAALHAFGTRTAIGPTLQYSTQEALKRIGVRARRGMDHELVTEVEVGVISGFPGEHDIGYRGGHTRGVSIGAQISHPRVIGVGVRYDDMPWPTLTNGARYVGSHGRARSFSVTATGGPLITSLAGLVSGVLIGLFIASGGFND